MAVLAQWLRDKKLVPGLLLALEGGKQILVGDVNPMMGRSNHCQDRDMLLLEVTDSRIIPLEDPPLGSDAWFEPRCDPAKVVSKSRSHVDMLFWYGVIGVGNLLVLKDGHRVLVGDINPLGGVCDSDWVAGKDNAPSSYVLRARKVFSHEVP